MNRIGELFKKDLLLGVKDVFVILEVGFAIVMLLLLIFLIPEDIENEAVVYIYDKTGVVENFIARTVGLDEMEEGGELFVKSRDEIITGMREEKTAIGLIISGNSDGTYNTELLTQPYTTEAMIHYVKIDIEDLLAIITPPFNNYSPEVLNSVRVTSMQEGLRDELPFNQRLLPAVLLMMVGIMGLFIMMSVIGQERVEGTIRAYRVTPAKIRQFLTSKHLLLLAIGFTTFSILYLPMMGFGGYLPSLGIILLTVIMGSSIGVVLGGIFDTPMSSILWVILLMIVLAMPVISLFSPAFSPVWIKFIPSYHTLFGLDAAMFPDNNTHIIGQSALILGVLDVVLLVLSGRMFRGLIGREA